MSKSTQKPTFLDFSELEFDEVDFTIQFLELSQKCGIEFKRMYLLKSGKLACKRGEHAHLNQAQLFFKLEGEIIVNSTDSLGSEAQFILKKAPLFIPNNYWIELNFSPNSKLLCLATKAYVDLETINDKILFLKQK